jgi:hypothetical protein
MSSNLAVINFAVGGILTVSGKITLGETVLSSSTASFQGLKTTNMNVTGTSTFNGSLPTSTQTPTLDYELTTKVYVDTADSTQKTYIDDADTILNDRITDTDSTQKTYIDDADTILNDRITSVDDLIKIYVDDAVKIYGKKGYYIQYGNKTYLESDFGFSQFMTFNWSIYFLYNIFTKFNYLCRSNCLYLE